MKLGYWGIRGLGQPIRFLATYLGVELDEKRYSNFDEYSAEKLNLGLDFPNLPYLIGGDFKMTECRAILKRIANGTKTYPSTVAETAICDMVENVLWDVWFGLLRYCNAALDALKGYVDNEIPKKLTYLNTFLKNKKYILGDQISYVDFIMYEMLFHFTQYQADYVDKYPELKRFMKAFEEIPEISKYIASSAYIKGPCNNPMAKIAF